MSASRPTIRALMNRLTRPCSHPASDVPRLFPAAEQRNRAVKQCVRFDARVGVDSRAVDAHGPARQELARFALALGHTDLNQEIEHENSLSGEVRPRVLGRWRVREYFVERRL